MTGEEEEQSVFSGMLARGGIGLCSLVGCQSIGDCASVDLWICGTACVAIMFTPTTLLCACVPPSLFVFCS